MIRTLPAAALMAGFATMASAQQASDVVATVNGTEITLGEMIITRSQLPQQYQQLPPETLFQGILDQLIQQQVLADTLENTPARVELALQNQRRSLLAGEAINAMMQEEVSDEALQEAYDEAFADAEPVQEYNASHILVETEEEAQAVLERLEAGEDFAEVAKEVSTDPGSGAQGGSLGWFAEGMMVEPFQAAVAELEKGGMTETPVETQFGFHVIRLDDTRTQEPPSLDEVREDLASQIQQGKIEERLTELEGEAEITRPEEGAFDPALLTDLDLLEEGN
ncbi:MAG: peptidylprolyl isomerase [Limimaricola soesokkakensis]|uniref:Parvulin-like PPIase n=1 Tax=Limimaricola soesokkakensis TaxID=1343159 RepID=A0A1X6YNG1_9RHOB|nr:peptidylprolyl isomerase [Limimaricola soesokkakensis]PSK88340.1 peptidyl-prolyl cis-trans isomerase C [Limimaricola soesokkakensis]SLN26533.1 putative parvulin-type peptidyl-prolyl cis-trans isomerase precursor [Limimaricola soesokkakensis]